MPRPSCADPAIVAPDRPMRHAILARPFAGVPILEGGGYSSMQRRRTKRARERYGACATMPRQTGRSRWRFSDLAAPTYRLAIRARELRAGPGSGTLAGLLRAVQSGVAGLTR